MKDGDLTMSLRALVMLGAQRLERGGEIDVMLGAGESLGRWRTESIVGR
jgi:hypothetical protein